MPKAFDRCVDQGGKVRTISGPSKEHGLKDGEYVKVCFKGDRMYRGYKHRKK